MLLSCHYATVGWSKKRRPENPARFVKVQTETQLCGVTIMAPCKFRHSICLKKSLNPEDLFDFPLSFHDFLCFKEFQKKQQSALWLLIFHIQIKVFYQVPIREVHLALGFLSDRSTSSCMLPEPQFRHQMQPCWSVPKTLTFYRKSQTELSIALFERSSSQLWLPRFQPLVQGSQCCFASRI